MNPAKTSTINFALLTTFMIFLTTGCSETTTPHNPELRKLSLEYFAEMQNTLKGELQKAMKSGGPAAAIPICKTASPRIEAELSQKYSVTLRRVSIKNRNPSHAPDKVEAEILELWEQNLADGNQPAPISINDAENFRVMQPIIIGAPICLKCHGAEDTIDPAALALLKEHYPNDKATGYKVGDLRGAFSAVWSLKK